MEANKSQSYYADSPLACYVGNACTKSVVAAFKSKFKVADPNEFTLAGDEYDLALLNGIKHAPNDSARSGW